MIKQFSKQSILMLVVLASLFSCKEDDVDVIDTNPDTETETETPSLLVKNSYREDDEAFTDFESSEFESNTESISYFNSGTKIRVFFPNTNPSSGSYEVVKGDLYTGAPILKGTAVVKYSTSRRGYSTSFADVKHVTVVNQGDSIQVTFDNLKFTFGSDAVLLSANLMIPTKEVQKRHFGEIKSGSVLKEIISTSTSSNIYKFRAKNSPNDLTFNFFEKPSKNQVYKIVGIASASDEVEISTKFEDSISEGKTLTLTYSSEDNFTFSFESFTLHSFLDSSSDTYDAGTGKVIYEIPESL